MRSLIIFAILFYACQAVAQNQYISYFTKTENPISEFSNWQVPGSTASQWGNIQTDGVHAFGVSEPTQFGDPTAILNGTWQANQSIQASVYVSSIPGSCCHEVEVSLRSTIASNSIKKYEILCPVHASAGYGLQIVRWNGPNGQYVYLNTGPAHQCVDGDVIRATATGTNPTNITVSITGPGGSQSLTACDNGGSGSGGSCGGFAYSGPGGAAGPWTTGNPGIGFYDNADSNWTNFGLYNIAATNSTIRPATTCSGADVASAIATASAGDWVFAPKGSCSWSGSTINVNGITLFGAGSTAARGTVITAGAFNLTKNASNVSRVEGFRFTGTDVHGTLTGSVSSRAYILGNLFLNSNGSTSFLNLNTDGGLIYNTDFSAAATQTPGADILAIHPSRSWTQPTTFGNTDTQGPNGGESNTYFEDSSCENVYETCPDGDQGNRLVMRHFTWTDSSVVMHAGGNFNDSGNAGGGAQQMEVYNSTFVRSDVNAPMNKWIWMRGESGVIANNVMPNDTSSSYPNKNNIQLGIGCNNDSPSWPVAQQIGQTTLSPENPPSHPLLIFGNTGTATTSGKFIVVQENATGGVATYQCPNPGNYVQSGRDYYTSNQWSWTPFTYPHPLRMATPAPVGTPVAQVLPSTSTFATTLVGQQIGPLTVTVTNLGTANLILSSASLPAGDFSITGGTCVFPATVSPSSNCTITIVFLPTQIGARGPVTLSITDNAAGSPHTMTVNGSGQAQTAPAGGLLAVISQNRMVQ